MKMNLVRYFDLNEAFCLKNRVSVASLEEGANLYGGATQIGNEIFSNVEEYTVFDVEEQNTLGLIVPGTIDVNEDIDNTEYVNKVLENLDYFGIDYKVEDIKGSWKSNSGEIVVENNKLVTYNAKYDNLPFHMNLLKCLAIMVKEDMKQEGVSIIANKGLIII